jgi:poly(3-hydroxybutyrate) depolymerase
VNLTARARSLAAAALLGGVLLPGWTFAQSTAQVPWRPGNAESFQAGATHGSLPVTVYRPAGEGLFPFVVLLHGCGGLKNEATWSRWVQPWAELFRGRGTRST